MLTMLALLLCQQTMAEGDQVLKIDNGVVQRTISYTEGHLQGTEYKLSESGNFIKASKEFSFLANDKTYSGENDWTNFQMRDTTTTSGGQGLILSMQDKENTLCVELSYLTFPGLPMVSKKLTVKNLGQKDLKLEGVSVENLRVSMHPTVSWVMGKYGRYTNLGPFNGTWDEPLVIVHENENGYGIAVGNETVGIIKRTDVFLDGESLEVGVTKPESCYPFRRWLKQGQQWSSEPVFTAIYNNELDPQRIVNTAVQKYTRLHMGTRVEQIKHKPMFVYNTWVPFTRYINDELIKDLAKAAAECGAQEFIIDDGWQMGHGCTNVKGDEKVNDWEVDTVKFKGGLKPTFDYIKSLGMKPGLWVSLARLDGNSEIVEGKPQWIIRDKNGNISDLHNSSENNRTVCMGTDWYNYIRDLLLHFVNDYGLAYVKLDLAIVTSAYVYNTEETGCYATDHPFHRDHEESYDVIYRRAMQLFDELHEKAPELFIDCTFETAGKLQLMDYGFAKHADGNWLSNVNALAHSANMRVRHLAWGRTPALPATSLVIGNLKLDSPDRVLALKSLVGTLPIMLGDLRNMTTEERQEVRHWTDWLKEMEQRHGYMSFRQDLPGFGEPKEGHWDGFARINVDTQSGGVIGVFRENAAEASRTVTVRDLNPEAMYDVLQGADKVKVATLSGKDLEEIGFRVELKNRKDGELFEILKVGK